MDRLRVLIADNHELVREGLVAILRKTHPEWEVVGEAADCEAIRSGAALKPDLAILGLPLECDEVRVMRSLVNAVPGIRVLVLAMSPAETAVRQMREAGVSAFVAKNETVGRLVEAMENVLLSGANFGEREPGRVQRLLTERELEVLRELALGRSNKEAAAALDMNVRTLETHRAKIMKRLEAGSLGQLVKMAIQDGVV
jgi:DNA-binding NarL/FixJ family response regulator